MNNFINVRTQAHNHIKIYTSFKHNLRHTQSSKSQSNDNPNYIVYDKKVIKLDNQNKKIYFDKISKEYQKDRLEHNEKFKAHYKRNLRPTQGSWMEGVFTFSDQIKVDLENKKFTTLELTQIAFNAANEISKIYGSELKSLILHMDETTPHFHYHIKNFDEKGMSLFNQNKNKNFLSNLQDIGFKYFGKLGMNRGIKKEITGKRYETIEKYHIRKEMELKGIYNNTKQDIEKSLKELYTEVNFKKNEVKDLRSSYDRTSKEYKNLTIVFKQLQDEEKTLREKVKELKEIDNLDNYLNSLKNDIKNILGKNTKQVNSILGVSRIEVENIKKMYSELVSKISEPLNSKVKEIETLKEENSKLKQEIVKKETRINELIVEKNKLNDTNSVLTNNNTQIKQKLSLDIQNLEKEQKSFLGTLKRQNQKLRDRTKYLKKILKDQNIKITRDQIRLTLNKPKPKKIEQELNNLSRI